MVVQVVPINLSDQGRYRCEVTYEDQVGRWFSDSCLVAHVTNLMVLGQPDFVRLSLENGTEVADKAIIGPFSEGQKVILRYCSSGIREVFEVFGNEQVDSRMGEGDKSRKIYIGSLVFSFYR